MAGTVTYNQVSFQHALLQAIAVHTPDFIAVMKEQDLRLIYLNEPGARLFGYKSSRSLLNKVLPLKRKYPLTQQHIKKMKRLLTKEGVFTEEVQYLTKTGSSFWGRLQVNRFWDGREKFLLIQIEKTDRAKSAEERLIKEKQRFGALMDYASIAVIIVNRNQEILNMNPFALKLFGYSSNEIKGKKIEKLLPVQYRIKHRSHHDAYFKNPQNRPMGIGKDLVAIKKDGSEFPVEVSLGTYKTSEDIYVIAYLTDITHRKQKEDEIKKLNADLENKIQLRTIELAETIHKLEQHVKETEETDRVLKKSLEREKELNLLKSRFVSTASHEFRTPLSTILSSAYLLQKYVNTEDQPKRDKHIERISASVNMLTDILNDFLSVGKIEEGKIAAKYSQFNIKENMEEIIAEIRPLLKKGQEIIYDQKGIKKVWLDPSMLKHIVMNLLSNAIKFSPENVAITIEVKRKGQKLELRITDKGIGISKDDQQHLFERFFRGANAANIQGTGLGLHIVKKYTELMNGIIQCQSELEKGTCFILVFSLNHKKEN